MAPRVLVSDKLSPAAIEIFKARGIDVDFEPDLGKDKDALLARIADYDGLAIRSATKVTAKIIEAATRLKVIGRAGIGVDNVDIPAASAKGIIVMNTPFGNTITTAEHAISMMLALARQIPEANASTQAGKWEKSRFMGVELFNKTLGLIGCGNIGSIVADRALGLRMRVIAFDPFLSQERAIELGVEKVDLEDLLKRADFISLHTPLTDKTRNILDAKAMTQMKKGCVSSTARAAGWSPKKRSRLHLMPGMWRGLLLMFSRWSQPRKTSCLVIRMWSARRILALPLRRRRRMSRYRLPSRCRTICCRVPCPMRSTCRPSRQKKHRV